MDERAHLRCGWPNAVPGQRLSKSREGEQKGEHVESMLGPEERKRLRLICKICCCVRVS